MKKKITLLIVLMITLFSGYIDVKATFEINGNIGPGEVSSSCNSGVCAGTVYGYYGISVRLMEMSNGKLVDKGDSVTISNSTFTFKTPRVCTCADGRVCNASGNPLNYCWEEYFNESNFDSIELEKILKKMGTTLEGAKEYYLKIVPLVKIKYKFYSKSYKFGGTHNTVVSDWYNEDSYAGLNKKDNKLAIKYAQGFLKKDSTNKTVNDVGGTWNVLRNYYMVFKLETPISPYIKSSSNIGAETAKSFYDGYNSSIYGKILIKISDYIPAKSSISLVKVDADNNNQKLSGAEFYLYTKSGDKYTYKDKCTSNFSGVCKIENLEEGTYYLKEEKAPSSYSTDNVKYSYGSVNSKGYLEIKVEKSEDKTIGNVTNEKTCTTHFDSLTDTEKNDMKTRIYLYKLYSQTNLLDLSKTTGSEACTNASCINTQEAGCLSSNFTPTDISANNLSCHTNTITVGTDIAFCKTILSATSAVGSGPFSAKSGQMYIVSSTGKATTLALGMKCYLYADNLNSTIIAGNFNDYFSNVQFDGSNENPKYLTQASNPSIVLNRNGTTYEYNTPSNQYNVDYYFKKIYANNGAGEIIEVSKDDSTSCTTCKFLGYGMISKLTDNYTNKEIPFNFTLNLNKIKDSINFSGNCKVTVTPELIINEKPRVVFRPVNTTSGNPFLDYQGENRQSGSNWKGYESIINNNNDSYNKSEASYPKYKIILTPSRIKDIRAYNKEKENNYSDYNLTCKPTKVDSNGEPLGTVCISNYLTTLKNNNVLEINNSKIRECFEGKNKTLKICTIE